MQQDTQRLLELLDQALATENEGIKVYEDAAAKSQDDKVKDIFQMLARAERGHYNFIENAKESVVKSRSLRDWRSNAASDIGREIEAIGRQFIPMLNTGIVMSATALDAIDIGIKVEQESIAFYTYAKTRVTEPAAVNMYNLLLASENTHLLFLEMAKWNT